MCLCEMVIDVVVDEDDVYRLFELLVETDPTFVFHLVFLSQHQHLH